MNRRKTKIVFTFLLWNLISIFSIVATNYSYDGNVSYDVRRDRIIAIAEDYNTLYYYCGPANLTPHTGVTYFDTTPGWRTGMEYCWGGQDSTKIYLTRISEGDGAGNINTGWSSSYDTYAAGSDCSGFVSNAWTSPRYATSGFPSISDDIDWDDLRMGDATNNPGSHIRLFDYFTTDTYTAMLYENTSGSNLIWQMTHRSLARDNNYQPIRYNNPSGYQVYDFPEPDITYIKRSGIERIEIRWDGQADVGFKIYQSSDGSNWTLIRDATVLTPADRVCEVSGLLPDHTYFFKMKSQNTGGDTVDSDVVAYRLDGGLTHRVLLVDGADRYREQKSTNHTFLTRAGLALASRGVGFDFCSNEAVVDEQINLADYNAMIWILSEESTFDETFSWAEQMHVQNFIDGGGSLFISGAEIGYDLDFKANSTTYKNGSVNDASFYNNYLLADYVADDANSYHVQGATSTIFAGLDFYFDNGTQSTYDVATPDTMSAFGGSTVGLTYVGGTGGNACVYGSKDTGKIVNFGFPFETIYPESARNNVMKAILNYFDITVEAPTIKAARQTASDTVTITWEGYGSQGFRLFQKIEDGSWTQIKEESTLSSDIKSTTVSGLSDGMRYAFKLQAVSSGDESADSDVIVCSLGSEGHKILTVDGYDRWNAQNGGANQTLLENFADALSANSARYDSCTNESVTEGAISLLDYTVVMWMSGEESTESETFSYDEQVLLQNYLKKGGYLFVSGDEIGWDLVAKANTLNDYSNGNPNDTPFYNNYLKTNYVSDDADTYTITGIGGTVFAGLTIYFDDGTHGTYNVDYPDIIFSTGGSLNALYYGTGPNVAGIVYNGIVPGGTSKAKIINFGFPFETIYDFASRSNVMSAILNYFTPPSVVNWDMY